MAYETLVPCPSCGRHVRATEGACPFCESALPSHLASKAVPSAFERMSRTKLAVFATTASMALAACGNAVTNGPGDGAADSASATDSSPAGDAAATGDAGPPDNGGTHAEYGAPPPRDAGPPDEGNTSADYGAPPPLDGGAAPPYGIPPPPDAGPG